MVLVGGGGWVLWAFPQSCSALILSKSKGFCGGKRGMVLWICAKLLTCEERDQDVRFFKGSYQVWASLWTST